MNPVTSAIPQVMLPVAVGGQGISPVTISVKERLVMDASVDKASGSRGSQAQLWRKNGEKALWAFYYLYF